MNEAEIQLMDLNRISEKGLKDLVGFWKTRNRSKIIAHLRISLHVLVLSRGP